MLEKVYKTIRRWLPAEPCALCKSPTEGEIAICHQCSSKLPRLPHPPLELVSQKAWNQIQIPFFYRDPLAPLIHQLKFDHRLHLARLFGLLFQEHLQRQNYEKPDFIIPVPLHKRRSRERGFNQAIEIIKGPAKALDIPLDRIHCSRTRSTTAQMDLSATERRKNLKSAFTYSGSLQGKHVALFDDVVTTGSTMKTLQQEVKRAGATKIDLWALAYTPPHQ